jgi:hypothetical protein
VSVDSGYADRVDLATCPDVIRTYLPPTSWGRP